MLTDDFVEMHYRGRRIFIVLALLEIGMFLFSVLEDFLFQQWYFVGAARQFVLLLIFLTLPFTQSPLHRVGALFAFAVDVVIGGGGAVVASVLVLLYERQSPLAILMVFFLVIWYLEVCLSLLGGFLLLRSNALNVYISGTGHKWLKFQARLRAAQVDSARYVSQASATETDSERAGE